MPKLINLTGNRFGRLLVVSKASKDRHGNITWNVVCDCGTRKIVNGRTLRAGESNSCGCFNNEQKRQICIDRNTTHGDAQRGKQSFEYHCWVGMIQRCENPSGAGWKNYGARGIRVCEEWRKSYKQFLLDMGRRPTPKHTIDRINSRGNYEPSNCRWATMKEQQNNRTNNRLITFDGKTQTLMQWAEETGISREAISKRLDKLGWTVEEALTITDTSYLARQSKAHLSPHES